MAGDTWQVEYGAWAEAWHRAAGPGFDRVTVGTRSYDAARDDLAPLRPKTGQACAVCRGALPQAFTYCFGCGAALHDAPVPAEPPQSAPNAGRAHAGLPGLMLPNLAATDGAATPHPVPLPAGRLFAFVLAGSPVRLFAIDRDGGWLFEHDRVRGTWSRLFATGEIALPEASWSAGAHTTGIVIAASGRLIVVDLTRPDAPVPVALALAEGDGCAGGPCIMQDEAVVPVMRAGSLQIARRRMGQDSAWAFTPVMGAPQEAPGFLAAPMTTETGVSWAGHTGYLIAALGDDNALGRMVWRGWSDGFTPSLAQRPYVDPDGFVWQFGSLPQQGGRRTACFERLGTQSQPRHERVGGSVLTNGVLACRLLTLRHRAWVEDSPLNHDLPGQLDEYLVPVQALGGETGVLVAAPDRLSELVAAGEAGVSPPILSGLRFFGGRALCDLARPVALRSLSQLAAFVFDGRLYVYDNGENECVSWALRAVGGVRQASSPFLEKRTKKLLLPPPA